MVMLNKSSDTIWLCVWTKKWQRWKLVFITKNIHIFVCNIIILLNIIFTFCPPFFICPFLFVLIDQSMFACYTRQVFWKYLAKLTSYVRVPVCITICVSYPFANVNCTVDVNWKIELLSMPLITSTTYLTCPVALIPRSIIT